MIASHIKGRETKVSRGHFSILCGKSQWELGRSSDLTSMSICANIKLGLELKVRFLRCNLKSQIQYKKEENVWRCRNSEYRQATKWMSVR